MLKIEFDPANKELAEAIGHALTSYATGLPTPAITAPVATAETTTAPVATAEATTAPVETAEANTATEAPATAHAETQTAPVATAETTTAPVATSDAPATRPKDQKGVPYHPDFVGTAKEPFYGDGKRAGQWKKRRGVDETAYDDWYAAELLKLKPSQTSASPETQPVVDSAAAFNATAQPANDATAPPAQPGRPTNVGEFFSWISEQQETGRITQDMIDDAYAKHRLVATDIFGLPEDQAMKNVELLLGELYV